MSSKKRPLTPAKRHRLTLNTPLDARQIIKRTLAEIFAEGVELQQAGKISNLVNSWLAAYEAEKTIDFEIRLASIEKAQKEETFRRQARNDQK